MDGAHLETARPNLEVVAAQRRTSSPRTMSGSIDEVPLPDLLQLFATSKKSGVLVVRTEDDVGRIFLQKGVIYYATINDLDELPPIKCIFRMLTWQKGLFDLDPSRHRSEFPQTGRGHGARDPDGEPAPARRAEYAARAAPRARRALS